MELDPPEHQEPEDVEAASLGVTLGVMDQVAPAATVAPVGQEETLAIRDYLAIPDLITWTYCDRWTGRGAVAVLRSMAGSQEQLTEPAPNGFSFRFTVKCFSTPSHPRESKSLTNHTKYFPPIFSKMVLCRN